MILGGVQDVLRLFLIHFVIEFFVIGGIYGLGTPVSIFMFVQKPWAPLINFHLAHHFRVLFCKTIGPFWRDPRCFSEQPWVVLALF